MSTVTQYTFPAPPTPGHLSPPFDKHVVKRVGYLLRVPTQPIAHVADLAIGAIGYITALVTLGQVKAINDRAFSHLSIGSAVIGGLFLNLVTTINPGKEAEETNSPFGTCTGFIIEKLKPLQGKCTDSSNDFVKHVCSRLTCALAAIATLVTSVVDFVLGLLAMTASLLTAGCFKKLNTFALINVMILPGTLLLIFLLGVFNPEISKPEFDS